MDEDKRPHDTSSPGEHPQSQDSRRDFIKTVVSAAAGLTLAAAAAGSEAHAAPAASRSAVVSTGSQTSLSHHLDVFRSALQNNDLGTVASYFAPNADYRSTQGIVRGSDDIAAGTDDALLMRGTADITSIKWISRETALVDGVFAAGTARGWFTEIWDSNGGEDFIIRASRIRVGPSGDAFNALSQLSPSTISDGVPDDVVQREEAEIRGHFKSFRTAFNGGDAKGVTALLTKTADANPVFSFLDGRAQVMNGAVEMQTKAANMTAPFNSGDGTASNSAGERKGRGALYLAGEPKVLRFLSPTVAVVDGTAEISNIPLAHGFAPKAMKGVYSTLWTKTDTGWLCEAARPWF